MPKFRRLTFMKWTPEIKSITENQLQDISGLDLKLNQLSTVTV